MITINKTLTENPFIDELVYNVKLLAINSVVKDEEEALKYETVESLKAADLFIACKEGRAKFNMFSYSADVLLQCGIPQDMIVKCVLDRENIPESKRALCVERMVYNTIRDYKETNTYYRRLQGLPPVGDKGLFIEDYIPANLVDSINIKVPIHELSDDQIVMLDTYGILDRIIKDHPELLYLQFLIYNKVDSYTARKAEKFQLLYVPIIENVEIYNRFRNKYEQNRVFSMKTVYSDAFKYGSDYYDKFMMVFIMIQTLIDMISEVQEYIARRELLDYRTIKYIFDSYNVPFFADIPLKYQIAMVKNINTLIKYKSTTKNMVDICSLFGFDNTEIFKYYLLKDRKTNPDGSYIFATKTVQDPYTGEYYETEDHDANYDLKFVKVPIDEKADDYVKVVENYEDYDSITLLDPTWDGEEDHEAIKSAILEKEFSYVRSKYISIATVYSVSEIAFDLPYFYNILFDDVELEEQLTLAIPYIDSSKHFRISDVFCYLFALTYIFNGVEDDIMDTPTKVMHIKGFNFKADMQALGAYIYEKGFTFEELGIDNFQYPTSEILTFNQLMTIFTENKKVHDHIVKQMNNADNKRIYDIYKKIYDSLMITDFNLEFFRLDNGEMAKTYTEFLEYRDSSLFRSLYNIKSITDIEARQRQIYSVISEVVYCLDEYLDNTKLKNIYQAIPSVSGDYVKQYLMKVINFFKSYKVDLLGITTLYTFDDKLSNTIKAIDDLTLSSRFDQELIIKTIERLNFDTKSTIKDRVGLLEKIVFDISRIEYLTLNERYDALDKDKAMIIINRYLDTTYKLLDSYDICTVREVDLVTKYIDAINLVATHDVDERIKLKETYGFDKSFEFSSKYSPEDSYEIRNDKFIDDIVTIIDAINKSVIKDIQYRYTNKESTFLDINANKNDKAQFTETISTDHIRDINYALNLYDIADRTDHLSRQDEVSVFERITITPY